MSLGAGQPPQPTQAYSGWVREGVREGEVIYSPVCMVPRRLNASINLDMVGKTNHLLPDQFLQMSLQNQVYASILLWEEHTKTIILEGWN